MIQAGKIRLTGREIFLGRDEYNAEEESDDEDFDVMALKRQKDADEERIDKV